MKYFFHKAKRSNFSPSYEGEREGVVCDGRKSAAFTLIELLIAIAIFSVVLIIITGVFSRFIQVQRHSIEQGTLILEMQAGIETFIKEARTAYGSTYRADNDGTQVSFINQSGVCVSYRLHDGVFERAEKNSSGNACDSADFLTDSQFAPLASKSITFTNVFFDAHPADCCNNSGELESQGVITLVLTAISEKSKTDVLPLTVQNTVTSRQMRVYAK